MTHAAHVPEHPDDVAPAIGATVIALVVLLALTAATVGLAFLHVPPAAHIAIALAIAATKAGVVVAFFMHLTHEGRLVRAAAIAGVLFLAILLLFILVDVVAGVRREDAAFGAQAFEHRPPAARSGGPRASALGPRE